MASIEDTLRTPESLRGAIAFNGGWGSDRFWVEGEGAIALMLKQILGFRKDVLASTEDALRTQGSLWGAIAFNGRC
ncbi:MAG: hypothetical protein AAGD25_03130 [Cyanobacteria bacterium P01_F01_bin.150]